MVYRTVIIEDQKYVIEAFSFLLNKYCSDSISIVGTAGNVKDAIILIEESNPDIVFMDIRIKGGTAFDVLDRVEYKRFYLVFTTAYEEHAVKAFKYSAIDYLLKPVSVEEMKKVIEKINLKRIEEYNNNQLSVLKENMALMAPNKNRLVISTHQGIHILILSNIIRVEAAGVYTNFFVVNNTGQQNKVTVSKPLGEYEELLSSFGFIRIHQSHIINIEYLSGITKEGMALLVNEFEVPISQRKKDKFISFVKQMGL